MAVSLTVSAVTKDFRLDFVGNLQGISRFNAL
jgi:hypothetical protein